MGEQLDQMVLSLHVAERGAGKTQAFINWLCGGRHQSVTATWTWSRILLVATESKVEQVKLRLANLWLPESSPAHLRMSDDDLRAHYRLLSRHVMTVHRFVRDGGRVGGGGRVEVGIDELDAALQVLLGVPVTRASIGEESLVIYDG